MCSSCTVRQGWGGIVSVPAGKCHSWSFLLWRLGIPSGESKCPWFVQLCTYDWLPGIIKISYLILHTLSPHSTAVFRVIFVFWHVEQRGEFYVKLPSRAPLLLQKLLRGRPGFKRTTHVIDALNSIPYLVCNTNNDTIKIIFVSYLNSMQICTIVLRAHKGTI